MAETWGIIPAAGRGSRIQPLGFSKELLPLAGRSQSGGDRPRAVSEYLVERMIMGGATRICFVIAPAKSDILRYYGSEHGNARIAYVVQSEPAGLCDAIFRAEAVVGPDDHVLVGLPDTIWFPEGAFASLPSGLLSFLLFPVEEPRHFDAVMLDADGDVVEIQVKRDDAGTHWVWGAFAMPAPVFRVLAELWRERDCADEYVGSLVNEYVRRGGRAVGIKAGSEYCDVGTLDGWRAAQRLMSRIGSPSSSQPDPRAVRGEVG